MTVRELDITLPECPSTRAYINALALKPWQVKVLVALLGHYEGRGCSTLAACINALTVRPQWTTIS